MQGADLAGTLEVLHLMLDLEQAIGKVYRVCGEMAAPDRAFWQELEHAEQRHAENIRRLQAILRERPSRFARNRSFTATALRTVLAYVKDQTDRLEKAGGDRRRMLSLAANLEQSLLESRYAEVVTTVDVEYQSLLQDIHRETLAHKRMIAARLAALPPA